MDVIVIWGILGLPWWLSSKESACQCRRHRFDPWDGKISWRKEWQTTPVFLPENSRRQRSLAGYTPWGCKELDTTERLSINTETLSSFHQIRTQEICSTEEGSLWAMLIPWSWTSSLLNCKKYVIYELPILWCFVTAAQMD